MSESAQCFYGFMRRVNDGTRCFYGVRGESTTVRGVSTGVRRESTAVHGISTGICGKSTAVRGVFTGVCGDSTPARGGFTAYLNIPFILFIIFFAVEGFSCRRCDGRLAGSVLGGGVGVGDGVPVGDGVGNAPAAMLSPLAVEPGLRHQRAASTTEPRIAIITMMAARVKWDRFGFANGTSTRSKTGFPIATGNLTF